MMTGMDRNTAHVEIGSRGYNGANGRNGDAPQERAARVTLHPSWEALIRYCEKLQFGELEKVRIQNGLPMTVEVIRTKVRFTE